MGSATKLLTGAYPDHGLEALRETGLIPYALPEITPIASEAETWPGIHREKEVGEGLCLDSLRSIDNEDGSLTRGE